MPAFPAGSASVALNVATCAFHAVWSTAIQPGLAATGFFVVGEAAADARADAGVRMDGVLGGAARGWFAPVSCGRCASGVPGRLIQTATPAIRTTATPTAAMAGPRDRRT
ncbi:hypothetical protein GCM10010168_25820 [Actinoplanes ianthinogenes]|uniref:Uncharacterized protein n=1 Tax=Actinoplanes ianthinogenes TaxID=122358 RepID=A0ABM7M9D8_9ACTN|nr:hypothetical protein Aiant_88790 [Actinoplanes ianthinogenes]GGR07235.1 hypothetical protein GCM10010168_25820 [Actinoplanes ianthinogenes]